MERITLIDNANLKHLNDIKYAYDILDYELWAELLFTKFNGLSNALQLKNTLWNYKYQFK